MTCERGNRRIRVKRSFLSCVAVVALTGGVVNALVTDEATAEALLR